MNDHSGKGYAQPVLSPFMYLRKSSELLDTDNTEVKKKGMLNIDLKRGSLHSRKPSESKKKFKFFD